MSHEKSYCPNAEPIIQLQPARPGVFDRVQLPQDHSNRRALLRDSQSRDQREYKVADRELVRHGHRNDSQGEHRYNVNHCHEAPRDNTGYNGRFYDQEKEPIQNCFRGVNRYPSHWDMIIRGHADKLRGGGYGDSRYELTRYILF
ncbi:Uncharacterized protein Rs2_18678 [Raphanus sativus]|nr:Uncharacterized protein Rs2_18678 [Raphanus sativus]